MRIIKDGDLYLFTDTVGTSMNKCDFCGRFCLHDEYVNMIEKLKEDNLLLDSYKLRCCKCQYLIDNSDHIIRMFARFHSPFDITYIIELDDDLGFFIMDHTRYSKYFFEELQK